MEKKIDELLNLVGLNKYRDRLAKDLSGGMKQKLSIACALIKRPEILILDEPTTGVDPLSRRDIFRLIEERLLTGLTVIFSTSYMDEAERAERIIMLNRGSIIGDYRTEDILCEGSFATISIKDNVVKLPINVQYLDNKEKIINIYDEFELEKITKLLDEYNIKYNIKMASVERFYMMRIREYGNYNT